jgi:hypothetical protein
MVVVGRLRRRSSRDVSGKRPGVVDQHRQEHRDASVAPCAHQRG